jgi:hypothetical protein
MTSEEAQAFNVSEEYRRYYIRMDKGKVNITAPSRVAKWFRLVGVCLGNGNDTYPEGDEVQTVEPWVPPDTWAGLDVDTQNRILDAIDAGLSDGRRYSDSGAAKERAAWQVIVKYVRDKSKAQASEIIKTWIEDGVIEQRDYEDPIRREKVQGLFVNADKRPAGRVF